MIDLDRAQDEVSRLSAEQGGWDPLLRVDGGVVVLRHPDASAAQTRRVGIVPALARIALRGWRVLVGDTDEAELRRQVMDLVSPEDSAGRAHVRTLRVWALMLVHRAYSAAAARLLSASVERAFAPPSHTPEARLNAASTAVQGADNPEGNPGGNPGGGKRVPLVAGGQRMPYQLGGLLWGRAAIDANPERFLAALERRGVRSDEEREEAARLAALIARNKEQAGTAATAAADVEVSDGGR